MVITLIRHTSVDLPPGICYGQTDVPLSSTFEEEASIVAAKLAGRPFDCVYTSPLTRCTRLAAYCGYADATRDDRLKEINFGLWEMQPFSRIADPCLQDWYDDYFNVAATGGESFRMLHQRLAAFFEELKTLGYRRVGVFAHGGILACAQLYAGNLSRREAFSRMYPYGSVIAICL
jgi:alpha-ribazole phosphatase